MSDNTKELRDVAFKPCPACPDGYVWTMEGPTAAMCPVCKGHAMLNLDGSPLRPEQIKET